MRDTQYFSAGTARIEFCVYLYFCGECERALFYGAAGDMDFSLCRRVNEKSVQHSKCAV